MAKDDLSKRLDKLRNKGIPIWSISRLNTLNGCEYEYYLNYILKLVGKDNIYGVMGGIVHDCLDDIHNDKKTELDMMAEYFTGLNKCKLFGMEFPETYIEKSWTTDMNHFVHNFKKLDGQHLTEHGFIFNLEGDILTGYIDEINIKDDILTIIDWKSSSEFKDEKLQSAGRQLILYALAYEDEFKVKVDKVCWYMLKYLWVKYDGKSKMVARRNLVKDIKGLINTQLKKIGYSEEDRNLLIQQAIFNNNLSNMPKAVQDRFKYEDCILYYDITEERVQELKGYIKSSIENIQSKNKEEDWIPKENPKDDFYCKGLCGHKYHCKYYIV